MTDSPGRPRDAAIDETVLDVTVRLLAERGYAGLRINDIAEASMVAKTTVYRRWPTLVHLVVAAVERSLGDRSVPSTGAVAADLDRLIEVGVGIFVGNGPALVSVALDIHRQEDPALRARYRQRIIDPFRDRAVSVVTEGLARGVVGTPAAPEDLVDAIIGGLLYRSAVLAEPCSVEQAKEFVWGILAGCSAAPR